MKRKKKNMRIVKRIKVWNRYEEGCYDESSYEKQFLGECSFNELPCPLCHEPMKKKNMLTGRINNMNGKKMGGNIDHTDGHHTNNKFSNLQPTHFLCNIKKGNLNMYQGRILNVIIANTNKKKKIEEFENLKEEIIQINERFNNKGIETLIYRPINKSNNQHGRNKKERTK